VSAPLPYATAAEIAREHGFSTRYWIRLAAQGKIPGAYQPSGERGKWVFERVAFRRWAKSVGLKKIEKAAQPLKRGHAPKHPVRPEDEVYFLYSAGMVKIGVSNDITVRKRSFSTAAPTPQDVVMALPGSYPLEREFHERFSDCRSHGEWFRLSPELRSFILENGQGEHLAHAERRYRLWQEDMQAT